VDYDNLTKNITSIKLLAKYGYVHNNLMLKALSSL